MPPWIEPFTLVGDVVQLEPLSADHVDDLAAAAAEDRSTFGFTAVPTGVDATAAYVAGLLAQRDAGAVLPFAQRHLATGRVVGCTRFMELHHWTGRAEPDEVEVGGTWLAASAQRTAVNTEAKLLLLGHAFEVWQVWRVAICTDARNERSRRAIERLGATFEGVLRSHRPAHGDAVHPGPRDTAVYSVIASEWPGVRQGLVDRLTGSARP